MVDEPVPSRSSAEPTEALTALVARLRAELTGVRAAMRNRAVIEQAKGVLVERTGITPDQAFDRLVQLSQRTNVKLIEVAAAIVGTTAPDPTAGDPGTATDETPTTQHLGDLTTTDEEFLDHLARTGARGRGQQRRRTRSPAVEALQAQHQLFSARVAAAASYDEVAEALAATATGWLPPAVVTITTLEPDGAHRLVGAVGLAADVRSQWSRIPPDPGLVLIETARSRTPVWLPDEKATLRAFPTLRDRPFPADAVFAAPLTSDDRVVGAMVLCWTEPLDDTAEVRRYLTALAEPVARRVDQLLGSELADGWSRYLSVQSPGKAAGNVAAHAQLWLPSVLDSLLTGALLLSPVRQGDQVVDFRIEYANTLARSVLHDASIDPAHATLLALYPGIGSQTLLPAFTAALRGGDPLRLTNLRTHPPTHDGAHSGTGGSAPGGSRSTGAAPATGGSGSGGSRSTGGDQRITVNAVRLWDQILMVFEVHGSAELLHGQLLATERVAGSGSVRWEPATGEIRCSPGLYRMFHGGERDDPVPPERLLSVVHPDDLDTASSAVARSMQRGEPVVTEVRGAGRLAGRRLRATTQPSPPGAGQAMVVVITDVTAERALEARLRATAPLRAPQRGPATPHNRQRTTGAPPTAGPRPAAGTPPGVDTPPDEGAPGEGVGPADRS